MPSPFPGMNPYFEQDDLWRGFHNYFLASCVRHLVPQLGPRYYCKLEMQLYVHEPELEDRRLLGQADAGIAAPTPPAGGTATAVIAPAYGRIPAPIELIRVPYVEVRQRDSHRVVTVVELLSPSNKYAGPDREQYLAKRAELLWASVAVVELDLLRGGPRTPLNGRPDCDYCAVVCRPEEWPRAGVWPWRVRDPMPEIPVPLREPDAHARLNLKAVLDDVYDTGGYAAFVYLNRPEPRLPPDDEAWAAGFAPPAA